MGLGASTEANDQDALDGVINREYGFRVHRVEAGSPGEQAGLQSILDYIVVANDVRLDADDGAVPRTCGCNPCRPAVCARQPRTARFTQRKRRPHAPPSAHPTSPPVPGMHGRYVCSNDLRVCEPRDRVHRLQHAHHAHQRDRAGATLRLGRRAAPCAPAPLRCQWLAFGSFSRPRAVPTRPSALPGLVAPLRGMPDCSSTAPPRGVVGGLVLSPLTLPKTLPLLPPFPSGAGLLGVTIRFDIARPLDKHTLHVLDVYPRSPAFAAGAAPPPPFCSGPLFSFGRCAR
jgi:hypothetical protein